MSKRKSKILIRRAICLMLSAVVGFTALPLEMLAAPQSAGEQQEDVLSLENDFISVHMSGKNGGFYISNLEGDKTIKSDNNKDLLYHNDEYDTSFTSFRITRNGETKDYIFGGDYSFEGMQSGEVNVSKDAKGLSATWTLGELIFTQRLELANTGSNEHGMVMIHYDVQNHGTEDVKVQARMLLDSAIGDQDYVCYEIPDTSYESSFIEKECVIDADQIPTAFYAYDDRYSPTATASTVISSKGMLKKIAFAHWNSLAATDFDFAPNPTLNFTSAGNDQYGTADSAMAMYYDLGTIDAGKEGIVNTYYGVFSNEKTDLEKDTVTFNMSAPSVLELSADGKHYISTCNREENGSFKEDGIFDIQATLKNISGNTDYKKIVVAAYAAEGFTPLSEKQEDLPYETSYAVPYQSTYINFNDGTQLKIPFYFRADVDSASSYRKITFRVFNLPDDTDARLLYENMLYETSMYILCPGGNGELPRITFHSATPQILYNELTRHLYVSGNNFSMLEDKSRYTLYAQGAADKQKYEIPAENISVDTQENKLDILFTKEMKPDTYQLTFEWTEPPSGVDKVTTGDALRVVMSEDIRYRNDYYGILAVVQDKGKTGENATYQIKTYTSEEAYSKDKNNYEETLLFFQGSFIKDDTFDAGENGTNARYVAKSIDGNKDKVVINGCIDALNGTVEVTQKDGTINTDFSDITLNASVENTRIYKGNAGFTSIENGTEYGLVPYNMDGEELEGFEDETITLIYPAALNGLMTLAGMAFNLSFARLGMMYDTDAGKANAVKVEDAAGFVMSFSAQLDLSFLIPVSRRSETANKNDKVTQNVFADDGAKADALRSEWNKTYKQTGSSSGSLYQDGKKKNNNDDDDDDNTDASVEVKNVLYGMNQGFLGVNFAAEVALPGYTEAMPKIEGTLEVNTVNDWSMNVEGNASFLRSITLEIKLGIKSKNKIPIVDNLYFYVQGVKPGINLDSFGVCWILGGGGGFENLYDTIFCCSQVPPIRLLLSVSFSLFQAMEARADLSLGLTGFGIKVSDLKVANTDIEIMDYAKLETQWIPYFKTLIQCSISYLGIIDGKGYIVIDGSEGAQEAFEAYAQAHINIPEVIPLIGGMQVGGAALGLNTRRIWGALKVLGFSTGISYAYGGDLSFGSQAEVEPTYPEYLEEARNTEGLSGRWYAVGYDEDKQDMLYMSIGSNIYERASSTGGALADANGNVAASLQSDFTKTYHNFTLGAFTEGGAQVLSIAYSADSKEEAVKAKEGLRIVDENSQSYALQYYDNDKTEQENENANANFSYNEEKKEATIVVSFTDANLYNKTYTVTTAAASELILYGVAPLPEVTSVQTDKKQYSNTDRTINLTWSGNEKMSDLEKLDVYIIEDPDADTEGGTPIASFETAEIAKGSAAVQIPETMEGGSYYVRLVYSQEEVTTGILDTETTFTYTNSNQPAALASVKAENAGDLQIRASLDNIADTKCQGALFKVYEVNAKGEKEELSDYSISAVKDENNQIYAVLGGTSETKVTNEQGKETVETTGLTAGTKYVIGVTPFNRLLDSEGNLTGIIYGEETFADVLTLNEPKKAQITLEADQEKQQVGRIENTQDENGNVKEETVYYDTYTKSDITFTAQSDMDISGTWVLDGEEGKTGTFTQTASIPIALTELADGDHTIQIYGTNANGDGFDQSFVFVVDTTAPTLMLTSPTNGSGFAEDGTLTISGITEQDAYMTITVDGKPVAREKTLRELGAEISDENEFSFSVNVGKGYYKKDIEITVSDEVGNSQSAKSRIFNEGMGNIKALDLVLSADTTDSTEKQWVSYTNKNLYLRDMDGAEVALQLCGITNDDQRIVFNDLDNVDLEVTVIAGSATLDGDKLIVSKDGHGFVEGKWHLAEGAAMSVSFTYGAEVLGQMEEEEGYQMIYHANGGNGVMTDPNSPYKKYDTVQAANCSFTRDGMEFVCWNTKADGSGTTYRPGDKFYITETVELYAIWKKTSGNNPSTEKPSTNKPSTDNPSTDKPDTPQDVTIGKVYKVGKAKYKVTSKNTVTYVASTNKRAKKLTIPATVRIQARQFKVTGIGAKVCKGNKKLTTVTIGKNVTTIAAKAFYNNKNLKKINIKTQKLAKIGKHAFKGINKKAVFAVPKKVKKKYKKKLNGKTGYLKKTMKIK